MPTTLKSALAATGLAALTLLSAPSFAEDAKITPPAPVPATPPAKAQAPAAAPAASAPDSAAAQGAWNAEVATPGGGLVLDDKQTALVKKVSDYFNGLNDLKGAFVQSMADGKKMKGKFLVKRPGRFRFDYALPSKQVIVSDGENLAIQDLDLNNEDRVALDQTPFRLLLRKDVDLARDAKITEVQESDDLIVLALQDKSPDAPGRIKLYLSTKPAIELKEWQTTDAQGMETRVEVSGLTKDETIDAGLFKIEAVGLNKFHP